MLSFFPLDVLDEIWDVIESVSGGFITYSFILNFLKIIYFILGTVIPYNISIFEDGSNESKIYYLKRFSIEFEFQFSHDIYAGPCF